MTQAVHLQIDPVVEKNGQGERVFSEVINSAWIESKQASVWGVSFSSAASARMHSGIASISMQLQTYLSAHPYALR